MTGDRELYARGVISLEQYERQVEIDLLRKVPTDHPLPTGWEPEPPCEHEKIEITGMGESRRHFLCRRCGRGLYEDFH